MFGGWLRGLRAWLLARLGIDVDEEATRYWWEIDFVLIFLLGSGIMGVIALSRL